MKFEKLSCLTLAVGVLADHLSTRLALTHPHLFERNPVALALMGAGRWLLFDVFLLAVGIFGVRYIGGLLGRKSPMYRDAVFSFPFTVGALRLLAACWNVYLYFSTPNICAVVFA